MLLIYVCIACPTNHHGDNDDEFYLVGLCHISTRGPKASENMLLTTNVYNISKRCERF